MHIWLIWSIVSLILVTVSSQPRLLRFSGISSENPKIVHVDPSDKSIILRLLGDNLPTGGYYFTTATKCEDYNLTAVSGISTVSPHVDSHECSQVTLSLPEGLPFDVPTLTYHLCHPTASADNQTFLQIHKKGSEKLTDYIGNRILLCCFCILMGAYSSGMTLGYMKFSIVELNRMILQGGPQAKHARRILRFRRRSNWLVVAFSLFSSVFTVLFTVNVEKMLENVPNKGVLKIIVPSLTLFFFAEMLPQAICNSKFGFNLASGLWMFTLIIFIVTAPIAWPASLFLARYLKRSMREVLTQEEKLCMIRNMAKNANANEKTIIMNTTTFSLKKVEELMVPLNDVFLLSRSKRLNRSTILTLVEKGYTRVPVCHEKNEDAIVGILNVKDLILVASELRKEPTVKEVLRKIEGLKDPEQQKKFIAKYVSAEMSAQLLLEQMKKGDFHIACVVKHIRNETKVVGIVTIEDILEEVFGEIDSSNETRVRSSVDDRGDNAVIGWCREAGSESNYPLSFTQQLRVLQELLKECTVFQKLGVEIMKAKQLLSLDRIRTAQKGQHISVENVLIVVWRGVIKVTRKNDRKCVVYVGVPSADNSNSEKNPLPSWKVPAYVVGKQILNELTTNLGCSFEEETEGEEVEVEVMSEEAAYFKLRMVDLNRTIYGTDLTRKEARLGSIMDRLSRTPTPTASPAMKSFEVNPETITEITPLIWKDKQP